MKSNEIYNRLQRHDRTTAERWLTLHTAMVDGFAGADPVADGARGALVGHLTNVLGHLEGAMNEAGYEDTDPRHLFTALALGRGAGSSRDLTQQQTMWLLGQLTENVGKGDESVYVIRQQTADAYRAITGAAIKARIPLPIPQTQEVKRSMVTRQTNVTTDENLPHLKTVSVHYERKLNLGDYNSATIGVQYWADLEEDVDVDAALDAMWEHAKDQVKAQALPLVRRAKGNGTPNPGSGGRRATRHPSVQAPSAPSAPTGSPPSGPAPSGPGAPAAPAAQGNGGDGGGDTTVHTVKLEGLQVKPNGKVEFFVEGLKWPLGDSRGAQVVAGLFDESLGWTAEHLQPGATYTPSDYGVLYVDWHKPGKYRDVIRVHA
jgi:hypothetical protein